MTDRGQLSDDDQQRLDAVCLEFRYECQRIGKLPDASDFINRVPQSLRAILRRRLDQIAAEHHSANRMTSEGGKEILEPGRLDLKPRNPGLIPPESSKPTSADSGSDTDSPETVIIPQAPKKTDDQKNAASKSPASGSANRDSAESSISEIVPSHDELHKYVVEEEIDRGGMGVVLRVHDQRLQRTIALKVIRGQEGSGTSTRKTIDTGTLQRFVREAQITGRLDHPGVVPIHELARDENDRLYFTMKYVEGHTLKDVLQKHRSGSEEWTLPRITDAMIRVCETLAFAHSREVIHRDLKPSNVMVGKFGEVYVMDWGLAKVLGEAEAEITDPGDQQSDSSSYKTMYGAAIGTPYYMPPEQAAGKLDQLDCRTDVYAAGAILYEILTGQRPYWSDPPPSGMSVIRMVLDGPPKEIRELNRKAAPELVAITQKAMNRNMADRYQSAADLAEDLRAFLSQRIVSAHNTGMVTRLKKWISRNQSLTIAGMLALLTTIVAMCVIIVREHINRTQLEKTNEALTTSIQQTEKANRQTAGLSLVSHAKNLTSAGEPELASLLAIEALSRYPFSQSREALYTAAAGVLPSTDLDVPNGINAIDLAWIPGDRGLVAVGYGRGYLRSLDDPPPFAQLVNRELCPFRSACCSVDGARILTSGNDGTLALWDSRSGLRTMEMDIGYPPVLNASDTRRPDLLEAAFCLNEQCAVTVSSNFKIHIIDLNAHRELSAMDIPASQENSADRAPLTSMKVSPNGRMLVIGDSAGHVQLWSLEERRLIKSVQALYQPVSSISFSSDSLRFVATTEEAADGLKSPSAMTRIFSGESGDQIASFESKGLGVTCAAWHPQKPVLAFGMSDQTLCLWDAETSSILSESDPQPDAVRKVRFAPKGRQLATQSGATEILLWQLVEQNGKSRLLQNDLLTGHRSRITLMEFDESGNHLASASRDLVRTWDLSTKRPVPSFGNVINPYHVHVSPKGDRVFALDSDKLRGHLWTVPDLTELAVINSDTEMEFAQFSGSGDHLVTTTTDGICKVWSTQTGSLESTLKNGFSAWSQSIAGQRLTLTGAEATNVWDLATGDRIRSIPRTGISLHMVTGIGSILLPEVNSEGVRQLIRVEPRTGELIPIQDATASKLLVVSTSGRLVCAVDENADRSESSDIFVVDGDAGQVVFKIHAEGAQTQSAAFNPDDSLLLVSYSKHPSCAAEIYSFPTGKRLHQFGEPGEEVPGWSASLERVVTRSADRGTQLWNGSTGQVITRLDPTVSSGVVDFSDDGSVCAVQYQPPPDTGGLGFGPVSLWNAVDGTLISALPGQNTFRFGSAFVPGGKHFLTLNGSGCLRLWPIDIEGAGPALFARKLTVEERRMYGIADQQEQADPKTLRERKWADFEEEIRLLIPVSTERRKLAWTLLDEINDWLGDKPSTDEKSLALKSVDRLITGTLDTDPEVLSKIALLHKNHGTASNAARIMEYAARHPRALSLTTPLNQLRREIAPGVASERAIDELLETGSIAENEPIRLKEARTWSTENSPHFAAYIKARELQLAGQFADAAKLFASIRDDNEAGPETILHCAECKLLLGEAEQAHRILQASLSQESVASPAVWNMWLRIGFHDLKLLPQQLLEKMPPDQPRTSGDTLYRTNVIQLLSTLAESKPVRINCGGERYVAANGDVWMADAFYNSGLEYFGTLGDAALFSHPIRNTSDEVLYQSERYFDHHRTDPTPGYQIPLPDGTYSVVLGFAEIYQEVRSFDVMVENTEALKDYDPSLTEDDWATAHRHERQIVIKDGQLDMSFVQKNGTDPKISCFQIIPMPGGQDRK